MCKIIAIANQKGGQSKSTTAVNLGIGLARHGKRVAIVDADPQGSATASLGYQEPDELEITLATILGNIINEVEFDPREGILHHVEGVDLIPANIELSGMEVAMISVMSRERLMREYLDMIADDYDYIIIDCSPSLGMMTINALVAASSVLIPCQASYLPVKGLQQLLHTISMVQRRLNKRLTIEGILLTMVDIAEYSKLDREAFVRTVRDTQEKQSTSDVLRLRTTIEANNHRLDELETLICRIYEDNILGKLPDDRYMFLSSSYEAERKKLTEEVQNCEQGIQEYNENTKSADRFIKLIDKYSNFEELTNTMLLELINKILVHERDVKGSSNCTQEIEIYFNFVGRYLPPEFVKEPTAEELAQLEVERKAKAKRHEAYLRRKQSGWQKKYEAKIKAEKKAKIEAMKEEIRREDRENGTYLVVADHPDGHPLVIKHNEEYRGISIAKKNNTEAYLMSSETVQ